jgi:Arc/MetJ family transcription regulator
MRTTVTLDDDVSAAVQRLREKEGLGLSEALNQLVRAGLAARPRREPYVHRSARLGLKVDISNIGEVLDLLDQR